MSAADLRGQTERAGEVSPGALRNRIAWTTIPALNRTIWRATR